MSRITTWRRPLAALVAVGIILLAGGVAVGSNMGFKLNKPLVLAAISGQTGNNWTSIPYNSPYTRVGDLCAQTGLAGLGSPAVVQFRQVNGNFDTPVSCNALPADTPLFSSLPPAAGIQIRVPSQPGAPSSIIIVGSHDPAKSITLQPTGAGQLGNYWFSVPYHTTAVTADDLCTQMGIPATSPGPGVFQRLDAAAPGTFFTVACPSDNAKGINLVLGEAIQIRYPGAPLSFIPAHF